VIELIDARGCYHIVQVSAYPSGEPLIKGPIPDYPTMLVRTTSIAELMAALFLVDAQRARGHIIDKLILPFVPGARQDRLNDDGDVLFTAKSVADMINARNFKRVVVVDPHSDVTTAVIHNCTTIPLYSFFIGRLRGVYSGVIAPDAGACKRAEKVAKSLGVRVYHAGKTRDIATGHITGFWVEPLPPGHYLVVDDICDGGGTFVGLADQLAFQPQVTADLFVAHGLFTQGTDLLADKYTNVICTDSLLGDKPRVTIFGINYARY
jgi:ribose-phosphate pyrophosphokinase